MLFFHNFVREGLIEGIRKNVQMLVYHVFLVVNVRNRNCHLRDKIRIVHFRA